MFYLVLGILLLFIIIDLATVKQIAQARSYPKLAIRTLITIAYPWTLTLLGRTRCRWSLLLLGGALQKSYNRVAPAPNSNAKPSTLTVVMRRIFFWGGERNTVLLRASPGVQGVCGFFAPLGKY